MRAAALALAWVLAGLATEASAAPPARDPDWPCFQRLVPTLTAATYWSGPAAPPDADWHADRRVAPVVEAVAPREVTAEAGSAELARFAESLAPPERTTVLPELFQGILDETNRERGEVIDRIKALARRQRSLGDLIGRVSADLNAIPEDAAGPDADRRAEIAQRRGLLIRSFEDIERTMRYACDVPVQLEARLGSYARTLEAHL